MYTFLRYLTAPLRFIAGIPRWFLSLSIPTRAALIVALLLVVLVVVAFFLAAPGAPERSHNWFWWFVGVPMGAILIPLSVWYLLRLWLQGDVSGPGDIDDAWSAGIRALRRHGLDLQDIPLFLVLGNENAAAARSLFQASGIEFIVENIPPEPAAPLHWYANGTAIYLACTDASCLSSLAHSGHALTDQPIAQPTQIGSPRQSITATIVPGTLPGRSEVEVEDTRSLWPQPGGDIRGTMEISGSLIPGETLGLERERRLPKLSDDDIHRATSRLEYLCSLIRRAREPLCGINGVLTLLPYTVIQAGLGGGQLATKAAREDLRAITRTLRLRYPVTALVAGMHTEAGFRELVRRVGTKKARSNRFGKGFGAVQPTGSSARPAAGEADQLRAVATHACGAFEDFIYALFAAQGGIHETGNRKLFALLCKVRSNLQNRLANILASAYGPDDASAGGTEPFFGGCYFGAAGSEGSSQAFVRSVLDKLVEQHEEVEWTTRALRGEGRVRLLGYSFVVLDILLALLILAKLTGRI
jgi:hypothetical protein